MEKLNYKISLLEMVGEMYSGVGLILIVKDKTNNETYEALMWVSPKPDEIKDKLVMPVKFLEREEIDRFINHPRYEEFIKLAWKILPKREVILKEIST